MRFITGFHAIEELVLKAKDENSSLGMTISYSKPGPRVKKILSAAKEAGIKCNQTDEKSLDSVASTLPQGLRDHRGIILSIATENNASKNIVNFDEWILQSAQKSEEERQVVVVLDSVTDPHNIGAIIRSCDQFGASLVLLPSHRSAKDVTTNEVISRASAGSSAWVPVSTVNNLVRSVQLLKEKGFWVYGADAGGQTVSKIQFPQKTVIIMGSEGSGISRLLNEQCDAIVSIPTCGKIDSLNVSVATGILLYENYRQTIVSKENL